MSDRIDTAAMYGEGDAGKVVADAIDGQRDRVFVITQVYLHNASRTKLPRRTNDFRMSSLLLSGEEFSRR
jgi:aryl-alcohol dehydrogenase-like predicted oxidoreductase